MTNFVPRWVCSPLLQDVDPGRILNWRSQFLQGCIRVEGGMLRIPEEGNIHPEGGSCLEEGTGIGSCHGVFWGSSPGLLFWNLKWLICLSLKVSHFVIDNKLDLLTLGQLYKQDTVSYNLGTGLMKMPALFLTSVITYLVYQGTDLYSCSQVAGQLSSFIL